MSSYSEFKTDVKAVTGGIIFFLIIGALIQLSVVLVMIGFALLIIPIARLLGTSDAKIAAIKAGIFYGVSIGIILSFFIVAFSTLFNAPAFQTINTTPKQEELKYEKMLENYKLK
jgi:uncharacterized membrane protein